MAGTGWQFATSYRVNQFHPTDGTEPAATDVTRLAGAALALPFGRNDIASVRVYGNGCVTLVLADGTLVMLAVADGTLAVVSLSDGAEFPFSSLVSEPAALGISVADSDDIIALLGGVDVTLGRKAFTSFAPAEPMTGATEGAAGLAATALPPDHAPVLRPDVDHRAADPGGYPGKNVIFGTPGDDVLLGGDGDDVFHPGTGNNILVGGAGSDTADFSDLPEPIIANLLAYSDSSGVVDTDHWTNDLIGVENVIGTAYDDDLNGNPQENELDGMGGDDYLAGLEGDDRLFGGDGSDVISGGSGADLIDGGPGWDLVTYFQNWNQPQGVTVNLATGTADDGFGCFDTLVGIEGIRGSGFGDVLIGDAGDNRIDGSYGNDEIHGGNSILRDTLVGGPGTDTFFLELSQGGYQEILDFEPGEQIVAEGAAAGESANYLDLVATMDGNVQVVNAATHVMVGLIVGGAVMGLDESIFG